MAQNHQPIAERDENGKGEEYCGCAPVSPPEERQELIVCALDSRFVSEVPLQAMA